MGEGRKEVVVTALTYKLSDVTEIKLLETQDGKKVIELAYRYVRIHIVMDDEKMRETLAKYAGFIEHKADIPVRLPKFMKQG